MRAALAILWDSLRLLQARRLFWAVLAISMIVALLYASIGFNERGMTILFGWQEFENPILREGKPEAAAFYTMLYTDVIVRWWLAWFAIGLALLSTANIFPDFLAEGSVGITLSKPLGRVRIFFLKYLGGLLFAVLQVALFTAVVFIAIGVRTGDWNLSVFWAVPIVGFVFSLVYSVAVLVGVWTKSTLLSVLSAVLVWGTSLLVQWSEDFFYKTAYLLPETGMTIDLKGGGIQPAHEEPDLSGMKMAHRTTKSIAAPFPKTRDATMYLSRMVRFTERDSMLSGVTFDMLLTGEMPDPDVSGAVSRYERRHSAWYVFGTSALFQAVVLLAACARFVRRDY